MNDTQKNLIIPVAVLQVVLAILILSNNWIFINVLNWDLIDAAAIILFLAGAWLLVSGRGK